MQVCAKLSAVLLSLLGITTLSMAEERRVKVDDSSFKCITEMTPVRHFYVDNLAGNLETAVDVARAASETTPKAQSCSSC